MPPSQGSKDCHCTRSRCRPRWRHDRARRRWRRCPRTRSSCAKRDQTQSERVALRLHSRTRRSRRSSNGTGPLPDFESTALRTALANAYALDAGERARRQRLERAARGGDRCVRRTGTPVVFARPTFALYEKLVTIRRIAVPSTSIPPPACCRSTRCSTPLRTCVGAVVIVCSPNNPTGGVLPDGGIDQLLATGATVLFDRAYGDFALDELPLLHDRLVTFSTFSKAGPGPRCASAGWPRPRLPAARSAR